MSTIQASPHRKSLAGIHIPNPRKNVTKVTTPINFPFDTSFPSSVMIKSMMRSY